MIISIKHKGLKRLWIKNDASRLPFDQVLKLRFILDLLNVAVNIKDIEAARIDLHPLKGDLSSYWSVKVKANWRIIFRFKDGDVYLVNYLDYH
jgi:proteic killer suppression protein